MIGYGLQLSASGALSALYRMDVNANNLANLSTVAFKPELAMARQRDAARVETGLAALPSNKLLERLGGGVLNAPNRISFSQGPLETTGNPLDVAIEGEGFFVVRDSEAAEGDRYLLTRDGRLSLSADNALVSTTSGMPVMDAQNRRIVLDGTGTVEIGPDGTVRQGGQQVARLAVVSLDDLSRVHKGPGGTFVAPADVMERRSAAPGLVRQYTLEGAAVDPIRTMLAVTGAGKAAEANFSMIQSQDRMMDRAINGLGRVQV